MLNIRRFIKNLALNVAAAIDLYLSPVRREFERPAAIYILMLRPLGLGDLMMLSPFVLEVAERFDTIPVSLVTEYPQFMDMGSVRWMHPRELDVARRRDGLVISPTLSWRHAKYLKGAGWYLGYFLSNHIMSNFAVQGAAYNAREHHYFQRAVELLKALEPWAPRNNQCRYPIVVRDTACHSELPPQYICIAPAANWEERQYSVERYCQIAGYFAKRLPVVLIGGNSSAEQDVANRIRQEGVVNLVGRTNLGEAAEIIARARLFIGNDSGLAHVAFLVGTPSLVIFGCVPGRLRIPLDEQLAASVTVLGAGETCRYFPCYDGFNRPRCMNAEAFSCLNVRVETVIEHAERAIDLASSNNVLIAPLRNM